MEKVWHSLGRFLILVLAAVWFQTASHTAICHSDNTLCGQDGCAESTACTCVCHTVCMPTDEVPVFDVLPPVTVLIPSPDETPRGLLLPTDIFRPPLTNS